MNRKALDRHDSSSCISKMVVDLFSGIKGFSQPRWPMSLKESIFCAPIRTSHTRIPWRLCSDGLVGRELNSKKGRKPGEPAQTRQQPGLPVARLIPSTHHDPSRASRLVAPMYTCSLLPHQLPCFLWGYSSGRNSFWLVLWLSTHGPPKLNAA